MKKLHASLAIAAAGLTTALLTAAAMSGPLDPPAGSVTSSYKTLSEVEPRTPISLATTPGDADSVYRISQPGSYYLTSNLTGAAAKSVIEVAVNDVTIDLNGFTITGGPGSLSGIAATVRDHIVVRNGSIRDCPSTGVAFSATNNSSVTSVIISDCGDGIFAGGSVTITDCTVESCDDDGIAAGVDSMVRGCISRNNTGDGIVSGSENFSVVNCNADYNGGDGIRTGISGHVTNCNANRNDGNGIVVGSRGFVLGSSANFNASDGIQTSIQCLVSDCSAANNTDDGIQVSNNATISGCTAVGSGDNGIEASAYSTISGCNVGGNGTDSEASGRNGIRVSSNTNITACEASNNAGDGIACGSSSVVSQCAASSNGDDGIVGSSRSLIERNTSSGNTGDGIEVSSDCRVISNVCSNNGAGAAIAAGIHATVTDNRIDDNTATDGDIGFLADSSSNIFTRNTATTNTTNYSLVTGNACLAVSAITTGAINGPSGGQALGSTDPWVNFSY